ncbi:MAG TPA: hypothetical protein VFO55_14945 [Gemmatimonadaceae bacterium]|nr:hypothetical protein [Gemmatimonadaceae bacterium]
MRRMVFGSIAIVGLVVASTAAAQGPQAMVFELRPLAGLLLPVGEMRDDFATAPLFGLQAGFELNTNAHIVLGGTFARADARFPSFTQARTNIWQFDTGAEVNLVRAMGESWLFRPFVGVGLGARTYDYTMPGEPARTCAAGYGALGAELQRHAVAVRFEDRNTLSCFTSPETDARRTRFDVGLALALVYHVM